MDIAAEFAKYDDEYLKFDRIDSPASTRPDLCAFIELDRLVPGRLDLISASEHDEYFLGIDCEALAKVATPAIIRDLVRCGVRYDESTECLCLFS